MTRFSILSLLLLIAGWASACIQPAPTGRYYIFYLPQSDQCYHDRVQKGVADAWSDMLGVDVTADDVSGLRWADTDKLDESDNPIVKCCVERNLREELDYLRLLIDYCNMSRFSYNSWDYPSKEDIARRDREIKSLSARAAIYRGTKLKPQYQLMRMRLAFAAKDWPLCHKIYEETTQESIFADMIRNLYAGVLYREGMTTEAYAIYSALGDYQSASWCAAKTGSVAGISEFYVTDPNSAVLPWLIREFCNNLQESCDVINDYSNLDSGSKQYTSEESYVKDWLDMIGARKITEDDVKSFGSLAARAVANPAVADKKLWLSAAALCYYYIGNLDEAAGCLKKAAAAPGTDMSELNHRYVAEFVEIAAEKNPDAKVARSEKSLKWMLSRKNDPHADRMVDRLVLTELEPYFANNKMYRHQLALGALKSRGYNLQISSDKWGDFNPRYSTPYFQALDSVPLNEVIDWKGYLGSAAPDSDFWHAIALSYVGYDAEYLDDIIGTRMLREGRFAEAEPYLQRVSPQFQSTQNISCYMAVRPVTLMPWERWRIKAQESRFAKIKSNPKLDWCRRVRAARREVEMNPQSRDAHYLLAGLYANAAEGAPCWWLVRYGSGMNYGYYEDDSDDDSETPTAITKTADFDFDGQCFELLRKAYRLPGKVNDVEVLFALAYAGGGSPVEYDWRTQRYIKQTDCPAYKAYDAVLKAWRANPAVTPAYISRCDVLKQL